MYDLIIIGAGPAGLSAAIYAVRKKLSVLVLASAADSQGYSTHLVENYLGLAQISGVELNAKFRDHAKKIGVETKEGVEAERITVKNGNFEIATNSGVFNAKSIIVATGKMYRALEVPGAKDFESKGISYCATCDAPIFKNKAVAVVGAGDAGQDTAWQLVPYAREIYLLNKYPKLRGKNLQLQEKIKAEPKIKIFNNCEPVEVKGEKFVKSLVIRCGPDNQTQEIAVEGIFVGIGSVPASKLLANIVKLNEAGEIVVDPRTHASSQPGIFAAGDVTDTPYKQMIIAAGEGAKAALSAYEFLKSK